MCERSVTRVENRMLLRPATLARLLLTNMAVLAMVAFPAVNARETRFTLLETIRECPTRDSSGCQYLFTTTRGQFTSTDLYILLEEGSTYHCRTSGRQTVPEIYECFELKGR